ncbi:A disintegrin and metalloproteinase with thrombospondin motifs 9-like [Haliotis rufescens]|uniref:A disintegrin and metalloproteinase with thrombospondin motifs 9-like n=1 Tax=Haliotis rufescens TaxID=6454 RepID=UPI00201F55D6|nr:A disintegrin and metalloproteinase with thrombospondin motifs 9-like [Haliotis rufescens]
MSDQVLIWETRLFCMILCHVLQSVLCFKGINFVITDDGVPPSLGNPQHLQIQQVSSLLECARSCAVNTPCDQFQFSDTSSTCIRRYTLVVNGGLVENVTGLFAVYSRNPKAPNSCSAIKVNDPTASDGEYYIYPTATQFQDLTVRVYCLMNDTHQFEYVTLPHRNFGEFPKRSNPMCTSEKPYLQGTGVGHDGITEFQKIRVDPTTMTVVRADYTFANWTRVKKIKYGNAADCYTNKATCGPIGTFRINTLGTGMKFSDGLTWFHSALKAKITRQQNGAIIDVVCGGYCGYCRPDQDMALYPQDN